MSAPASPPPTSRRRRLVALALLGVIGLAAYPTLRYLRAEYHFRRAERSLAAEEFDEAGSHLVACLEVWPDSGPVHLLAAQAARRSNLSDEAAEHLEAAQKALGRTDAVLLEWAMLNFQRGGMTAAIEAYLLSALQQDPPEAELILEALAQGYMRAFCLEQALRVLDEWVRRHPDSIGARLRRGWVHDRKERWEYAEEDYRTVLASHPGHAAAKLRLAQLLLVTHRGKEALPYFQGLLARQPDNRVAKLGLAAALAEGGRAEEARAILDEMLAARPDDAEAMLERGKLALEEGQNEAAERWLRRAAQIQPHDYATQFQLLQCLHRAGKKAEAREQERRVHALTTDLEEMNKLTGQLQARPNDPDLRCRIGQLFLRCGEEREGKLWLEGVLQIQPDHAPTRQILAELRARKK